MCNGLIYMITPTPAEVLSGGTLPLSTIARRRSTGVNVENNTIVLSVPGYYKVDAEITLSATAPGDVKISAYKNGASIPPSGVLPQRPYPATLYVFTNGSVTVNSASRIFHVSNSNSS